MTTIAGIMIIELECSGLQNAFDMEFSSVETILLLLILFYFILFYFILFLANRCQLYWSGGTQVI